MINTLIELPYKIARAPLSLMDSTLSQALPETSPPRRTLDLVIGSTDKVAGALLGDRELGRRGDERIERSKTLRRAARREHEADAKWKEAEKVGTSGRQDAARKRDAAEQRATESLKVADVVEADDRREAKANAKKEAAAKKLDADRRAEHRAETIEEQEERASARAEAKKQAGQRQASAMFDQAREADRDAAMSRDDAETLEELAEAKKRERKAD